MTGDALFGPDGTQPPGAPVARTAGTSAEPQPDDAAPDEFRADEPGSVEQPDWDEQSDELPTPPSGHAAIPDLARLADVSRLADFDDRPEPISPALPAPPAPWTAHWPPPADRPAGAARPAPGAPAERPAPQLPPRPYARPPIKDDQPSLLGLTRRSHSRTGSRLFTAVFVVIFLIILFQVVARLVTGQ